MAVSGDGRNDFVSRWGVVIAAVIAAVGAVVVAVINLSGSGGQPQGGQDACGKGSLAITSIVQGGSGGSRSVQVEGKWNGPPLSDNESVYALARPVAPAATGVDSANLARAATISRGWYTSEYDVFRPDGSWAAEIAIPSSESRKLVIQAIVRRPVPRIRIAVAVETTWTCRSPA